MRMLLYVFAVACAVHMASTQNCPADQDLINLDVHFGSSFRIGIARNFLIYGSNFEDAQDTSNLFKDDDATDVLPEPIGAFHYDFWKLPQYQDQLNGLIMRIDPIDEIEDFEWLRLCVHVVCEGLCQVSFVSVPQSYTNGIDLYSLLDRSFASTLLPEVSKSYYLVNNIISGGEVVCCTRADGCMPSHATDRSLYMWIKTYGLYNEAFAFDVYGRACGQRPPVEASEVVLDPNPPVWGEAT